MAFYGTKKTDYGYKEKITVYSHPIRYGMANPSASDRQRYEDMSKAKQELSDDRRVRYYKQKTAGLVETAIMNRDLSTAVTLTFRETVTSYGRAVAEWTLFIKRLRHLYPDKPLKYICVWEYQKERGRKEGIENGGVFHFHALMNIGYLEHATLEKIWGNGHVWIEQLGNDSRREKAARYTAKYITKEIASQLGNGGTTRGMRFFFTSNNLQRPAITVMKEKAALDSVIFDNLENMIKDGIYDIKNDHGQTINHVEYVEYRKT